MLFHLGKTLAVAEIKPSINEYLRGKIYFIRVLCAIQNGGKSETLYQNYSRCVVTFDQACLKSPL